MAPLTCPMPSASTAPLYSLKRAASSGLADPFNLFSTACIRKLYQGQALDCSRVRCELVDCASPTPQAREAALSSANKHSRKTLTDICNRCSATCIPGEGLKLLTCAVLACRLYLPDTRKRVVWWWSPRSIAQTRPLLIR